MKVGTWMHDLVNHTALSGVALVIHGPPGSGKSQFVRDLARHLGDLNVVFPRDLSSPFSLCEIEGKKLVVIEADDARKGWVDYIRPLIANDEIVIERKGHGAVPVKNISNFIILTSHKDAIPLASDDRRFMICELETAQLAYELALS